MMTLLLIFITTLLLAPVPLLVLTLLTVIMICNSPVYTQSIYFFQDSLALILILLTLWLLLVINSLAFSTEKIKLTLNILGTLLILFFSSNSILWLYIWFEASLIPIFAIILKWGYQPERIKASIYLMFYTVTASLPLLMTFLLMASMSKSFVSSLLPVETSSFLFATLSLAFLVKLPLFFMHLWLLKAHVEAPVEGSMILAALLLKLGSFGLYRLTSLALPSLNFRSLLVCWALFGAVSVSFACYFQPDVKSLIALSSVAHMGFVAGTILSFTKTGLHAALIISVGHAFTSSGLFLIAFFSYSFLKTRNLKILKATSTYSAYALVCWFILAISNMAAPPSLSTLGEILAITSLFSHSTLTIFTSSVLVFMAAAYSLNLFLSVNHGKSSLMAPSTLVKTSDLLLLFMHWFPLFILITKWIDI